MEEGEASQACRDDHCHICCKCSTEGGNCSTQALQQCLGVELYKAIHVAFETPEIDRSEHQQLLLAAGVAGRNMRLGLACCSRSSSQKRLFHQACVPTTHGNRSAGLAKVHAITRSRSSKDPAGPKELNDLRHFLCEDCLQEATNSNAVCGSHLSGTVYTCWCLSKTFALSNCCVCKHKRLVWVSNNRCKCR